MANMLLSGALLVCLNQVASVLALGLKTHMEPSFDPLVSLQPEFCALPRGHYIQRIMHYYTTPGLAIVQHTPVELICATTTNTLACFSCSRLDHGGWGARRVRHIWRTRLLPSRQREARRLARYAGQFLYQLSPADTMSALLEEQWSNSR